MKSDDIDNLLREAHEAFLALPKTDKKEDTFNNKYKKILEELYQLTILRVPNKRYVMHLRDKIKKELLSIKILHKIELKKQLDSEKKKKNIEEIIRYSPISLANEQEQKTAEDYDEMFNHLFPYERTLHIYCRWLTYEALFNLSYEEQHKILKKTRPFKKFDWPDKIKHWSSDLKMMLIDDIAASIAEILIKIQQEQSNKRTELEKTIQIEHSEWEDFKNELKKIDELHNKSINFYNKWVYIDKLKSNNKYILRCLSHTPKNGIERIDLLAERIQEALQKSQQAQIRYRKKLRTFNKKYADILEKLQIIRKNAVISLNKELTFSLSQEHFECAERDTWYKFYVISRMWVNDCIKRIQYTVSRKKGLKIDIMVYMPASLRNLLKHVNLQFDPISELNEEIKKGEFYHYGFFGESDLKAAINRAIKAEKEMIRICLELCGPDSYWTQYYAHLHDKTLNRMILNERYEKIKSEYDTKVYELL